MLVPRILLDGGNRIVDLRREERRTGSFLGLEMRNGTGGLGMKRLPSEIVQRIPQRPVGPAQPEKLRRRQYATALARIFQQAQQGSRYIGMPLGNFGGLSSHFGIVDDRQYLTAKFSIRVKRHAFFRFYRPCHFAEQRIGFIPPPRRLQGESGK